MDFYIILILSEKLKSLFGKHNVQDQDFFDDLMDAFKKQQKKSEITEDDLKNAEKDIQKLTDDYISDVDKMVAKKEKELSEI